MIKIRAESATDSAAIERVVRAAFPGDGEARLVAALRKAGKLRASLVAEVTGQIVGHLALSNVTLEPPTLVIDLVGLAPVAVQPEWQRQGIGSKLIESALRSCRELGIEAVVVLGEPAFYGRFGFRRASDFGLANVYGVDDPFMVIELQPNALAGVAATVRYASEFDQL